MALRWSTPLAQQVKRQLLERIALGTVADEDGRLPSETQLSEEFGVSRATMREALSMLAREGVIIRRQGIGTFINHNLRDLRTSITEVVEFEDLIAQQGYQASVKVLSVTVEPAGTLASSLNLSPDEDVFCVEKVFLADGIPVIYCYNAVPMRLILPEHRASVVNDATVARQPIYRLLLERCHQDATHQISKIGTTAADRRLSDLLDCQVGRPLLCIEEVGYNDDQEAVLYCLEYYRDDMVRFQAVRKVARPFSWEQVGQRT